MNRTVSGKDIYTFAKFDMVYNQLRMLESQQNETKYRCHGSGNCCTIGLTLHMSECANIAFKLRQQYYLYLEDKGNDYASSWMDEIVDSLINAMYDETWEPGGATERKCVFFKGGCTIYGFRPMICRTVGTISTVDDFCPRERNEHGGIDYFTGPAVERIVKGFQDLMKEYAEGKDAGYDVVVYMPLGILSFLLPPEKMVELSETTDSKFWRAAEGWQNYKMHFTQEHGYFRENFTPVTIGERKNSEKDF